MTTGVPVGQYGIRYTGMPIDPIEEQLEKFHAGAVTIGVEFRVLTDDIVAAVGMAEIAKANGAVNLNDEGVSLHVYAKAPDGDKERLRFDCFNDDPHYHYVDWPKHTQDIIHLDPVMTGDVLTWALTLIRTRLPQLLERAGIADAARLVDPSLIEDIMPKVTEAAYRARCNTDKAKAASAALKMRLTA
jgi:hypothetical protein